MSIDERSGIQVVASGYDEAAERYQDAALEKPGVRSEWFQRLLDRTPAGEEILEVGSGFRLPVARAASVSHRYLGIGVSRSMISLARRNVPGARFERGDIVHRGFRAGRFAGIASFHSLLHVPRERHAELFRRFAAWLRPVGHLALNVPGGDDPGTVYQDFPGNVPMFFSHFPADVTEALIEAASFKILEAEFVPETGGGAFRWVLAVKS